MHLEDKPKESQMPLSLLGAKKLSTEAAAYPELSVDSALKVPRRSPAQDEATWRTRKNLNFLKKS